MGKKLVLLGYCFEDLPKLKKIAEDMGLKVIILLERDDVIPTVKKYGVNHLVGVCCSERIPVIEKELDNEGVLYKSVIAYGNGLCPKEGGTKGKVKMRKYEDALKWLKNIKC